MMTYRQISKLRRYVNVEPHAIDQYLARIDKSVTFEVARQKLVNAFLRGTLIPMSSKRRFKQVLKYFEDAKSYKYGDLVVVARVLGPREEKSNNTILTCYRFTNSKFDPGVFD